MMDHFSVRPPVAVRHVFAKLDPRDRAQAVVAARDAAPRRARLRAGVTDAGAHVRRR
jgi:hypothetical protein